MDQILQTIAWLLYFGIISAGIIGDWMIQDYYDNKQAVMDLIENNPTKALAFFNQFNEHWQSCHVCKPKDHTYCAIGNDIIEHWTKDIIDGS